MVVEQKKVCPICGRDFEEYDSSWPCKTKHNWQKVWRLDKSSQKYKDYLERRRASMQDYNRRKLEKLNKETPTKYKSRNIK